jgi:hypothetical protein
VRRSGVEQPRNTTTTNKSRKRKKLWLVTMELWRESYSGYDQCDDKKHTEYVMALGEKSAIRLGTKQALDPGKGMYWSQYCWTRNAVAVESPCKQEKLK